MLWRRVAAGMAIAFVVLPALAVTPAGAQPPDDRYALAGGSFRIGSDGPFRFQATDLGRYLIVDTDGRFVVSEGRAEVAGPDTDWQIDQTANGLRLWLP